MGDVVTPQFGKPGAKRFGMTTKQRKALAFIQQHRAATGNWPTMKAIGEHVDAGSTLGTILIVQGLVDIGAVEMPAIRALPLTGVDKP